MSGDGTSAREFHPVEDPWLDNDPLTHLSRAWVYFLQNLYREFPVGSGMRWTPSEEDTELIITAEKPRLDAVMKTPHITCVLGAARWANLSLDQLRNLRYSDGRRVHTDLVSMTVAFHCQAKEGIHARRLAWNSSFFTNVHRRTIQRAAEIHHVSPQHDISAESPPTTYQGPTVEEEIVAVVATVPFYWQPQWRITKPATLWRNIRLNLGARVDLMPGTIRKSHVGPPKVGGIPVNTTPIEPKEPALFQEVREDDYEEE